MQPTGFAFRRAWLAVAAALLLAVSLVLLRGPGVTSEQLAYLDARKSLVAGDFNETKQRIKKAAQQGVDSDRLRSLESQADRQMPAPIALSAAGRLSDFGYDVGGTVAREPASLAHREGLAAAQQLLDKAGQQELEVVLNRGHLRLSLNEPERAVKEFNEAVKRAPNNPLTWLGLGLAKFMVDDFAAAEETFRRAVELDSANLAARINLAMTLEEQGKAAEAVAAWRVVLERGVADQERQKIELSVNRLETESTK